MSVVIANIIDLIAALIQVGSGSIKQKTKILIVQIVQLLMQAVSMLLLGGITGAISNVLSCFRNYLCYKDRLNVFWKAILIAASIGNVPLPQKGSTKILSFFHGVSIIKAAAKVSVIGALLVCKRYPLLCRESPEVSNATMTSSFNKKIRIGYAAPSSLNHSVL